MSDPVSELAKLRAELAAAKAELAQARAVVSTSEAMIAGLKLEIALLKRAQYGHSAERKKPVRKPLPRASAARTGGGSGADQLHTARGSNRIAKIGEDITETLEVVPRQWKVIQTVREKFTRPATARKSRNPRRRSIRRRAVGPGRACWR